MRSDETEFMPNNPRFNAEQYKRLTTCSCAEWNDWRKQNRKEKILLEGARFTEISLQCFDLSKAHLSKTQFIDVDLRHANLREANLEEAVFELGSLQSAVLVGSRLTKAQLGGVDCTQANFDGSCLDSANLSESILSRAHLIEADLRHSFLTRANFDGACLKRAILKKIQAFDASFNDAALEGANLEYASITRSHLKNARLERASLVKAQLAETDLRGTILDGSDLRSANLRRARVDETTSFWHCFVDRATYFGEVPLGSVRIDTGTLSLLEYNLRRRGWKSWCNEHKVIGRLASLFWTMSDYGLSTTRIIESFLIVAIIFALIYWISACLFPPGIISNLAIDPTGDNIPKDMLLLRSIYFSIVTMTTLGFGDMYATPKSIAGHALLILQVILGYVMLGAIVTRFSILFTQKGPAAEHFDTFDEKKCKSIYWSKDELFQFAQERETKFGRNAATNG